MLKSYQSPETSQDGTHLTGLSACHISPNGSPGQKIEVEISFVPAREDLPYRINDKVDWKEVTLYEGGDLLEAPGAKPYLPKGKKPKRGQVFGLSDRARGRMMRKLAKINRKAGLPVFFTGTYHEAEVEVEEVKRGVDRWGKSMLRRYPGSFLMWRLEWQERGAPHIHALIWNGPKPRSGKDRGYYPGCNKPLFENMARMWCRATNQIEDAEAVKASCRTERIRSRRGAMWYVAKYLGKSDKVEAEGSAGIPVTGTKMEWTGRVWGMIGRGNMAVFVNAVKAMMTTYQWLKLKLLVRAAVLEKTKGRVDVLDPSKGGGRWWQGVTVFLEEVEGRRLLGQVEMTFTG